MEQRDAAGGAPVGMLCINFDDSRYREVSELVLKLCHPDAFVDSNFVYSTEVVFDDSLPTGGFSGGSASVATAAEAAIEEALRERGLPAERLTLQEKKEIVAGLERRGVFQLKGAVELVAQRLHSSKASVYRYMRGDGEA